MCCLAVKGVCLDGVGGSYYYRSLKNGYLRKLATLAVSRRLIKNLLIPTRCCLQNDLICPMSCLQIGLGLALISCFIPQLRTLHASHSRSFPQNSARTHHHIKKSKQADRPRHHDEEHARAHTQHWHWLALAGDGWV